MRVNKEQVFDILIDAGWFLIKTAAIVSAIMLVVGAVVFVEMDGLG